MRRKLPKSLRKFIRLEKARIRREFSDIKKQKDLISELYPVKKLKLESKDEKNKVNSNKNEPF